MKVLRKETVFKGKLLSIVRKEVENSDGSVWVREVVTYGGSASFIVPVYNEKFIFVKQFRPTLEDFILEFPAGRIEENETPERCAIRELEEETGLIPKNLKFVFEFYPSPGFVAHGIGLPQKEEDVEKFYEELRKRFNVIVHPFQGGFIGAYKGVKNGDIATIVSDRDLNKDGVCVEFFEKNVTFPKGASVLAYRTKVNSVFATLIREHDGYKVYFSEKFDIDFNLEESEFSKQYVSKFASVLEKFVRMYPTQWFHFFDYFEEYKCS